MQNENYNNPGENHDFIFHHVNAGNLNDINPADIIDPVFGANVPNGINPANGANFPNGINPPNAANFPNGVNPVNGINPANAANFPNGANPVNGIYPANAANFPYGANPVNGINPANAANFPYGANPANAANIPNGVNPANAVNFPHGVNPVNDINVAIRYNYLLLPVFIIWFSYFSCACANVATIHLAHPDSEVLLNLDFSISFLQLLGVVIAGRMTDYITTKKVLLFVIGALIVYFLLMSNATHPSALYLAAVPRTFIFLSLVQMIATAEIVCSHHRHQAFGLIVAFEAFGQVAGLSWGYFFTKIFGVKMSFLMSAILSGFALFILWKAFPDNCRNPPDAGFWTSLGNCGPAQIIQTCSERHSVIYLIMSKFLLELSFAVMTIKLMSRITCHPQMNDDTFWVIFLQPLFSLPVAVAMIPFLCHSFPIRTLLIIDAVLILISYLFLITVKSFSGFLISIFLLSNELIFWFVVNAALITRNIPEAQLGTFLGLYALIECINPLIAKLTMIYVNPQSTDICIHTFGGIGFVLACPSLILTKKGLAGLRGIQQWRL